ncbi:hypothetical protein GCM10011399_15090 [Subtercola lobariae]|uniref:Uncharacterized protein n=1 Tax=Subtercola lobariae TaxID=1588641 RepID=A0A917EXV9_9MICO|nr:hypothetical protein GCM10011399_15090 [Subtercola lobariae]
MKVAFSDAAAKTTTVPAGAVVAEALGVPVEAVVVDELEQAAAPVTTAAAITRVARLRSDFLVGFDFRGAKVI